MNNLNRRTALRILGGVPIAAAAIDLVSCNSQTPSSGAAPTQGASARIAPKTADPTPCLNILLHGMFALNFDYKNTPNTLTVLAPKVYGHTYGAGDWTKEKFLDQEDGVYTLQNAAASNAITKQQVQQVPGAAIAWKASGITGIQPGTSNSSPYCTLKLGIPDDIWALRRLLRTTGDLPFFEGTTAKQNNLDLVLELPLVYVLTYRNVDKGNPPNFGDWKGAPGAAYWNLHIYAEPSFASSNGHLSHSLSKLCQMFAPVPLDLRFKTGNSAVFNPVDTDLSTGHSTVGEDEEESLEEVRAGIVASSNKTSQVHSCMSLIALNG